MAIDTAAPFDGDNTSNWDYNDTSATTRVWFNDASVTTDSSGTATFGVASSAAGTVSVRVYDAPGIDNDYATGETTSVPATQTVVAGGGDSITAITPAVVAANDYNGTVGTPIAQTIKVTLKNGTTPIAGVIPVFAVTAGPNAGGAGNGTASVPADCSTSLSDGTADCTYFTRAPGTDTIVIWVNKSTGTNAGVNPGEVSTTVTRTLSSVPTTSVRSILCAPVMTTEGTTPLSACTEPLDAKSVKATLTVLNGTTPVAGAVLQVSVVSSTGVGTVTLDKSTVTTDASGGATVTATATAPTAGGNFVLTYTLAGQAPTTGDLTITYAARVATTLSVSPTDQAAQIGGKASFTVLVVDQFGAGFAGVSGLTYSVIGRNVTSGTLSATDASGKATFSYNDQITAATPNSDSVTVNSTGLGSAAATVEWYANAAAGVATVDVTGAASFLSGTNAATYSLNPAVNQSVAVKVTNTAGTPLAGKTVTFTLTGGATIAGGTATTGTALTGSTGVATISVNSTKSGAVLVTATVDGVNGTGTITYGASSNARNITPFPASDAKVALAAGDLKVLRFKVTDGYGNSRVHRYSPDGKLIRSWGAVGTDPGYGNPVPNVNVTFSNAGAGFFFGGTNSATATTASDGVVSVTVTSLPTSFGAANVTATIDAAGQPTAIQAGLQCTTAAGSPVSTFTAGNCATTAVVTIGLRPTITVSNISSTDDGRLISGHYICPSLGPAGKRAHPLDD